MARLLGPDPSSRRVIGSTADGGSVTFAGRAATAYLDEAATQLASIAAYNSGTPTTPGATISGSVVRVESDGRLPLFWFPDGVDTLYLAVVGLQGVWQVNASVDARLDALTEVNRNLADGRRLVAARLAHTAASVQAAQNTPLMNRIRHVCRVACADVRLVYGAPLAAEADGAVQPMTIKVGLEFNGVTYPVTWAGKQVASWDPGGVAVISDPVPVQLGVGDVFYTRSFAKADAGAYVTLAAGASIGDTTIQLSALPGGNTGRGFIGQVAIESPREVVTIINYSGSSAPYTATLAAALTSAHSSGAVVGGTVFQNISARNDLGEATVYGNTDNSWTTTAITSQSTNPTTTLSAGVSIGDTKITTAGNALYGPTATIDGETVTIRNAGNGAAPFTYYLAAPLTANHSSGATVTGSIPIGIGIAPTAIVADRVITTNPPPPVVVMGDSIANGVGNYVTPQQSFATLALDAAGRPWVSVCKSGETAQSFADLASSRRRRTLLTMAGWALYAYGVNDAYSGRTFNQMVTDTTTILGWLRQRGLKVALATLTPRTNSTDQWVTTTNQTVVGVGSFNTVRVQYNAWVRSGAAGLADLVLDIADATETARDSGVWKADASGPYTADGIHPTYAGHLLLMQPAVTAALTSMT